MARGVVAIRQRVDSLLDLAEELATPHPAICMIFSDGSTLPFTGSLVDIGDKYGTVLSVAHTFRQPDAEIIVQFGRQRYMGDLVEIDREDDLVAILITRPEGIVPIPIAKNHAVPDDRVWFAGYGQPGGYRRFDVTVIGYGSLMPYDPSQPNTRIGTDPTNRVVTLQVRATARNCDSGAPIMNSQNELVAVVSYSNLRINRTAGTYCGVIRRFLGRVHSRLHPHAPKASPPNSQCPLVSVDPSMDRLDAIESRLDELMAMITAIPAGSQGIQGTQGEVGEVGEQGSEGQPGSQGDQGIQGEQGESGEAVAINMDVLVQQVIDQLLGTEDEEGEEGEEGLLLPLLPPLPLRQIEMKRDVNGEWVEYSETVDNVYFSLGEGITIRLYPPETEPEPETETETETE